MEIKRKEDHQSLDSKVIFEERLEEGGNDRWGRRWLQRNTSWAETVRRAGQWGWYKG